MVTVMQWQYLKVKQAKKTYFMVFSGNEIILIMQGYLEEDWVTCYMGFGRKGSRAVESMTGPWGSFCLYDFTRN